MTKTFAENLRDGIYKDRELDRLTNHFRLNPNVGCATSLSYSEAKALGFEVSYSQRDGVFVSLPQNSQYGDH